MNITRSCPILKAGKVPPHCLSSTTAYDAMSTGAGATGEAGYDVNYICGSCSSHPSCCSLNISMGPPASDMLASNKASSPGGGADPSETMYDGATALRMMLRLSSTHLCWGSRRLP